MLIGHTATGTRDDIPAVVAQAALATCQAGAEQKEPQVTLATEDARTNICDATPWRRPGWVQVHRVAFRGHHQPPLSERSEVIISPPLWVARHFS